MTHLTPDELIDALEGVGHQAHLAECERCRRELAELSAVLSDAKQASVPEPSPLFWPHFSERVRTAIHRDAPPAGAWPSWLRWQVLLPLGAAAMIILGLMFSVPEPGSRRARVRRACTRRQRPARRCGPKRQLGGPRRPGWRDGFGHRHGGGRRRTRGGRASRVAAHGRRTTGTDTVAQRRIDSG